MASIIWLRSLPARPTNGRPCASSSAPGPSPTKTKSALGLPSAKTMFLRALWSLQRLQSPRSSRIFSSVSPESLFMDSKSEGAAGLGRKVDAGAVADGAAGRKAGVAGPDDRDEDAVLDSADARRSGATAAAEIALGAARSVACKAAAEGLAGDAARAL